MGRIHKGRYCPKKNWVDKTIGYPQSQTNRDISVPVQGLDLYELDIAYGEVPPETTYEEWREMQRMATNALEVIEYGDNA